MPADSKANINELKQCLTNEYGMSRNKCLDLFEERKPKLNEKPRTFALSLQHLLDKAMPTMNENNRETLLKNKFSICL